MAAGQVGQLTEHVNRMCYPFQVAGTHDAFRPAAAFHEGLPSTSMTRQNAFYEIGSGLLVFLGEEPWYRLGYLLGGVFQRDQGPRHPTDGGGGRSERPGTS